jgi:hypothetical protein
MKITLAKIKKHNPCTGGWEQILEAQGPDLDREWELVEAFDSNDLDHVLWALRCLPEHNGLWRKYAVWCVMQVEHLLIDQRSKDALEVAWRHSNGMASDAELAAGIDAAWAAAIDATEAARDAASIVALDAEIEAALAKGIAVAIDAENDAAIAARNAAWDASDAAGAASDAAGAASASALYAQKNKLIQILTAGEWVEENGK